MIADLPIIHPSIRCAKYSIMYLITQVSRPIAAGQEHVYDFVQNLGNIPRVFRHILFIKPIDQISDKGLPMFQEKALDFFGREQHFILELEEERKNRFIQIAAPFSRLRHVYQFDIKSIGASESLLTISFYHRSKKFRHRVACRLLFRYLFKQRLVQAIHRLEEIFANRTK